MLLDWNFIIYTLLCLVPFIEQFQLYVILWGGAPMISLFDGRLLHTHRSLEPSRPEGSLKAGVHLIFLSNQHLTQCRHQCLRNKRILGWMGPPANRLKL